MCATLTIILIKKIFLEETFKYRIKNKEQQPEASSSNFFFRQSGNYVNSWASALWEDLVYKFLFLLVNIYVKFVCLESSWLIIMNIITASLTPSLKSSLRSRLLPVLGNRFETDTPGYPPVCTSLPYVWSMTIPGSTQVAPSVWRHQDCVQSLSLRYPPGIWNHFRRIDFNLQVPRPESTVFLWHLSSTVAGLFGFLGYGACTLVHIVQEVLQEIIRTVRVSY